MPYPRRKNTDSRSPMVSEDFLRLVKMIYDERWTPTDSRLTFSQESGLEARIVLERDGAKEEIVSLASDFWMLVAQIKETADSRGEISLKKVRDTKRYYADLEYLMDEKGEKLRAAARAVVSDEFHFEFEPFEGIRKILRDHIPVNDPDVRGVKEHYYESYAQTIAFGRRMAEWFENFKNANPKGAICASAYEEILREAFMPQGKQMRPVADYRRFLDTVSIDVANLGGRILEQTKYTDFLMNLVVKEGRVEIENGVRAVLDVCWRMCELSYPLLNVARIAIEMSQGKRPKPDPRSFEELVRFLRSHEEASVLVEFVEPVLRNSEAHVSTSVFMENHNPIVLAYDTRVRPARELARMPFSIVDQKTQGLKQSRVLEAMYFTLALFEFAFQILVLRSPEFKLLLVALDQL